MKWSFEGQVGLGAVLSRHLAAGGAAEGLGGFLAELDRHTPAARKVAQGWSESLALGLSMLTNAFDPAQIVFGGPLTELLARCLPETRAALGRFLIDPDLMPDLSIARTGAEGAALGCALLLNRAFLDFDQDFVFGGSRAITP